MPSHGSLTKAGKVRNATPKIPPKPKKNLITQEEEREELQEENSLRPSFP